MRCAVLRTAVMRTSRCTAGLTRAAAGDTLQARLHCIIHMNARGLAAHQLLDGHELSGLTVLCQDNASKASCAA